MPKLRKLNLTLRIKSKPGDDSFPAVESAQMLKDFAAFLEKAAYTSTPAPTGEHPHRMGGIVWEHVTEENDG